ncbi:WecB/TagA/CpsF family glycosyltransferase [Vagococcus acidifermentans]|uniref:Glycosyltransferase n=1 Tax=Vagococcus acidifermentans TaxID=564710 RepID=A0A430APM0_9ENTE|nr:WecB/TagA/CpsF family glycosyltransferase [Vagococcus acidifermentans]RSU10072.1 glycosyltransferase [Vagococcus acidifermentans]
MKKVEYILDVPVDRISLTDILSDVPVYLENNDKMLLTSVNPQIVLMADKDTQVKEYIKTSTHRFPDGIGLVKVSKLTDGDIHERVAGIDVMTALLEYANQSGLAIFLYGAKPEVVEKAAVNISKRYPRLRIAGTQDGYTAVSDEALIAQINRSGAHMLFVALGSPKQELWLAQHYQQLDCCIYQTVGGSFDVLSGMVKRAPDFYIRHNLEWLYRSLSNPKRLYRIIQLPWFVIKAVSWHRRQGKKAKGE